MVSLVVTPQSGFCGFRLMGQLCRFDRLFTAPISKDFRVSIGPDPQTHSLGADIPLARVFLLVGVLVVILALWCLYSCLNL